MAKRAPKKQKASFEHRVEITGSYYAMHPDPARNYGVSGNRIRFIVIGPKGAVQWIIGAGWYVKQAREHLAQFPHRHDDARKPDGWDLGYHSPKAMYDSQKANDCDLLSGGKCFYDGSGLNADLLIEGFLARGTEWLWPKLEEYYRCIFEAAPFPDFTPNYVTHAEIDGRRGKRA